MSNLPAKIDTDSEIVDAEVIDTDIVPADYPEATTREPAEMSAKEQRLAELHIRRIVNL